jgi:hypothetical protein
MTFLICFLISGGWELLYEFTSHVFGEESSFSGVPMFMGHYCSHMNSTIKTLNPRVKGFFSQNNWRVFIQGAVARWMASFPKESSGPCCALDVLGGDGTGIGITVKTVQHVAPIWDPPSGSRNSHVKWGRNDRCAYDFAAASLKVDSKAIKEARTWLKKCCTVPVDKAPDLLKDIDRHCAAIPQVIYCEFHRWSGMLNSDSEFLLLRFLFRCLTCQDSVTGLIHPSEIASWRRLLPTTDVCAMSVDWPTRKSTLVLGVSIELVKLLDAQMSKSGVVLTTIKLIKFLGTCLHKHW